VQKGCEAAAPVLRPSDAGDPFVRPCHRWRTRHYCTATATTAARRRRRCLSGLPCSDTAGTAASSEPRGFFAWPTAHGAAAAWELVLCSAAASPSARCSSIHWKLLASGCTAAAPRLLELLHLPTSIYPISAAWQARHALYWTA